VLVFVTYHEVKRLDEARRAKSLSKYWLRKQLASGHPPAPGLVEPGEVIELAFGAQCEHQIGA
jgi:hypothetical protein